MAAYLTDNRLLSFSAMALFQTCTLVLWNTAQLRGEDAVHPATRYATFAETRDQLPAPIYQDNLAYLDCYWHAWEVIVNHIRTPTEQNGFVSPYVELDFNQHIFFFDTCLMTMFLNYGDGLVPGISSLDNFYAKQHDTGEICREISSLTGRDHELWTNQEELPLFSRCGWRGWDHRHLGPTSVSYRNREVPQPNPRCTLDALNHPIAAWAEWESYLVTGDTQRLRQVWQPLTRYFAALHTYLRQGNGLYITDWASMDNSQRNLHLDQGGTAVDTSAEMALTARCLAAIADAIGQPAEAQKYRALAQEIAGNINALMWDDSEKFYYDLSVEGERSKVKTVAAFWTLLSGVASPHQARALAAELQNPDTFKTLHRVPSLSAGEAQFAPGGEYWRGSVWTPMNMMIVRGLERYGYTDLAREIALNHLDQMAAVYLDTGALWENYAPQKVARGDGALRDLVGFTGLSPINFLLEYAIGLRPDAPNQTLTWHIQSTQRVGCERYRWGKTVASLVCEPPDAKGRRALRVESNASFQLRILHQGRPYGYAIEAGKSFIAQLPGLPQGK